MTKTTIKTTNTAMTAMTARAAAAAAALLLGFCASSATAAGPSGFGSQSGAPQGFGPAGPQTVAQVIENGRDDERVLLKGAFTKHIRGDKYEFADASGKSITAELDDDRDWSMIVKDKPVEILAEVDRDWNSIELDVKAARPAK